jgi:predicted enzyme related to lactoylglutathione lyase
MTRFFQVTLRTLGVVEARAFYTAVLGRSDLDIVQLHEQSVARGARPHWLGLLDVGDVERAAAAFAERGAIPLGPKWVNPQGLEAAVMRDPGGAVVALAKPPAAHSADRRAATASSSSPDIVWYELNTVDVGRAKANYAELFGWEFAQPVDLENLGVVHPFAWGPGGAPVGSMCDIAGRPGVHPHWLFHLRAPSLAIALDAVRASGGTALDPLVLPNGDSLAICDDPQGAAFAVRDRPASSFSRRKR